MVSPGESFKLRDSVGVEDWDRYIREMSQHGVTWGDEARGLAEICRDRDEMPHEMCEATSRPSSSRDRDQPEIGRDWPRVGDAARGLRHLQDGDRRHLVALSRLLPHHHAAGRVEGAE